MRSRLLVPLVTVAVTLAAALSVAAPAGAVGAEVYETDDFGNRTRRVIGFGNTSPSCCCISHGQGLVGYGVEVCYLPIP